MWRCAQEASCLCEDNRTKCYKKCLEGWPRPKLPVVLGSGGQAPSPLPSEALQQPAEGQEEHLLPRQGPFSPFQQEVTEQPLRLGEGRGTLWGGEGHSQAPLCE